MRLRHRLVGGWLVGVLWMGYVPGSAAEEPGLGIEEVVAALRQEVEKIKVEAKKSGSRTSFKLDRVALRIQFVMVRESGPDGKPHLKIIPVEVGQEYRAEAVHTLTLQMEPTAGRPAPTRRQGPEAVPLRRKPSSGTQQQPQEQPQQEPSEPSQEEQQPEEK